MRNTNQIGAARVYPLRAAACGCIGITIPNSGAAVAPHGSREPFLGTNPIAIAVPGGRHAPFVLDMATSVIARQEIFVRAEEGRPIPLGWALDVDGNPTTDAAAALAGPSLPLAGPKGSALALLADILAGVLTGAEFGGRVRNAKTNQDRPAGSGNFHLALRIEAFLPAAAFAARLETLIARVHVLRPAQGFERVRLPGERIAEIERDRRRNGIPLRASLVERLTLLGKEYALRFPRTRSADATGRRR